MSENPSPIPEGFHSTTPYLIVPDAGAALDFYRRAFHAVVTDQLDGPEGIIVHAAFRIGDSMLMIGSHPEVQPRDPKRHPAVSLYLHVADVDEVFARALAAGAIEIFPVSDKFYGNREGGLVDPAGITWWIATRKETLSSEEIQQRAAAFRAASS